jgi:hypothetical protein
VAKTRSLENDAIDLRVRVVRTSACAVARPADAVGNVPSLTALSANHICSVRSLFSCENLMSLKRSLYCRYPYDDVSYDRVLVILYDQARLHAGKWLQWPVLNLN